MNVSFLLDTNLCSEYIKRPGILTHRFVQFGGRMAISSVALAEWYTWAYLRSRPDELLVHIETNLLRQVSVLDFDAACARRFGILQGVLRPAGLTVHPVDLMIGATALVHDATLVTRNLKHFAVLPDLRITDWTAP